MPQPKKFETSTDQKRAWASAYVERVPLDVRKDAEINRDVIKKAAAASGQSLAGFIMSAIAYYIPSALGDDWLEKNGNKSGAGGE